MTNPLPAEVLEQRAAEQRRRLHNTAVELRSTVREKLDIRRNAEEYSREYFWQAAGAVAFIGLLMGFTTGGIFARD